MVLYTRRDCPLCDEMKAELKRSRPAQRYALREVDIEGDPELERLHGLSIPVLAIAGRAAFKGRMTAADFERKLARRAAERRAERTG
ncbi:MAG: glutaredoxin family protein [Planctomycetota bacterium]